MAKPHRSSYSSSEPAPRCPELSRTLRPSLTVQPQPYPYETPPRKAQPGPAGSGLRPPSIISRPRLSPLTAQGCTPSPVCSHRSSAGQPRPRALLDRQRRRQWQNEKKKLIEAILQEQRHSTKAGAGWLSPQAHRPEPGAWLREPSCCQKIPDRAGDGEKIPAHRHGPC